MAVDWFNLQSVLIILCSSSITEVGLKKSNDGS